MTDDSITVRLDKLARLRAGGKARVLEICSGCGGLSLGLEAAGFELSAHIEIDPEAAQSYAYNFGRDRKADGKWAKPRDMERSTAAKLVAELGLETTAARSFDLVAAGLPCQAFARIGRSKLRSVAGEEDAFQRDPRASLYRRFLRFVKDAQPLAIIIENVPDILNYGGHNVPEEICETLGQLGYNSKYTILNAAFYGVPQVRERLFILALAEVLKEDPNFPSPTHFFDLPRGYEGSRQVALKHVSVDSRYFIPIPIPVENLPQATNTKEALGDLPIISEHLTTPTAMRKRKLSDLLPYRSKAFDLSPYAYCMRSWPGFETGGKSNGHLVRLTPRDFPIFAKMGQGADYPVARKIAEQMFADALRIKRLSHAHNGSKAYQELLSSIVPPYDPMKFPNKWWKLDPGRPSRTLTAHMGKDTYSHIHYDSAQQRTISVREAARLQSFPDGFQFAGAMNAAFRQIGNAVPPLLAKAVAEALMAQLNVSTSKRKHGSERRAA